MNKKECPIYGYHCTCWYDAEGPCCGCLEPQITKAIPHPIFDYDPEIEDQMIESSYIQEPKD